MDYKKGKFESTKFDYKKDDYSKYLEYLNSLNLSAEEIIHQFPAYVGSMTIQRYLTLYDLYKKTLGIAGHLAEVGVYKGSGSIFLSKLVEIILIQIEKALERNERVELRDIFALESRTQKARTSRNPKTNEIVKVPEKKTVHFKMSKKWFKDINNE